jgi:crotonobetainyl-CoA:carnitine CoA-transferase CaiB-like acyl-CoA transferase
MDAGAPAPCAGQEPSTIHEMACSFRRMVPLVPAPAPTPQPLPALPLDGIRVLDLTQVMAGPFCTMQLGDMGADVIKVEPPGTGDLSRSMGGAQLRLRGRDNAPFLALNRNKRSITLDLKHAADRERFLALVPSADILVENFRPGVMQRLGLGWEALRSINHRLVYASISGFGQDGPYADRPGFDLIAQGMAGVMSVTGTPGGEPVKCGVPIADLAAGLYATNGILAALIARQSTGRGQYLETSLFESALALSVWEATEYWATGQAPHAMGSAHRLNAPYQVLATRDGHLALAAITDAQWRQLCTVLGLRLAEDARFATNADRMRHRDVLAQALHEALAADTTEAWVARLLAAGVPAGPIHDYAQVFADPHTRSRAMVQVLDHPVEGKVNTLGFAVKMSGTPLRVRRPPPLLGEHTDEVLAEWSKAPGSSPRPDGVA